MTRLVDIETELGLFAVGITGKNTRIHESGEELSRPVDSLDSYKLVLPSSIHTFDEPAKDKNLYLLQVMEQIAFREFDTFEFNFELACQRIPEITRAQRESSHNSSDLERFFDTFDHRHFAASLFCSIEVARLWKLVVERFPGLLRLDELSKKFIHTEIEAAPNTSQQLILKIKSHLLGFSELRPPWKHLLNAIISNQTDVYSSAKATLQCYRQIFGETDAEDAMADSMSGHEYADLTMQQRLKRLETWDSELQGMNAIIEMSEAMTLTDSSGAEGEDVAGQGQIRETDLEKKVQMRDQLSRKIDIERSNLGLHGSPNSHAITQFRYDEWDYLAQSWKKKWCTLYETASDSNHSETAEALIKSVKPLVRSVRKKFEQLRPSGMRRINRLIDGDELDLVSVVNARTDIRTGHTADERVYSHREHAQRDVSALFLVDLSASTDDPAEPKQSTAEKADAKEGPPQDLRDPFFDDDYLNGALSFEQLAKLRREERKIIDIEKESVLVLATALEELGDLYSVCGFSGYGRHNVEVFLAKDFDERLNADKIHAIANMKPMRSTRMGPAIRHATHKLLATGCSLKVLMVISDGFPQDCDYGPDRSSHEYGIHDTAQALEEATAKGVQTFCITVDKSGNDYLKSMCPDERYAVLHETSSLPMALQDVYRSLTTRPQNAKFIDTHIN